MIHFVVIRHGETIWNKERRYQGSLDTSLTAKGKKQIQRFVSEISKFQPDIIFSSHLGRAIESANILCKPLGKKPKIDARLGELGFGAWEGKTAAELMAQKDPAYLQWYKGKVVTPKGGESLRSFQKRINSFIRYCEKNFDNKKIIIVTHGGAIRMFLSEFLDIPHPRLFQFRVDPGSITVIGKYQHSSQLILLNSPTPMKGIVPIGCV